MAAQHAGLGDVPKPSYEVDHLDKEYKGRNGTPEDVSKPEPFDTMLHVRRNVNRTTQFYSVAARFTCHDSDKSIGEEN